MNKLKKLTIFSLCLLVLLVSAGCNKSDKGTNPNDTGNMGNSTMKMDDSNKGMKMK